MKIKYFITLLLVCLFACKNKADNTKPEKFDKIKWETTDDNDYPYREKILKDFIANYKVTGLTKEEIINLLGQPDRSDNGYLFYTVAKEYIGNTSWPFHTKTLVIKLTKDSTVEWRKIHE